MEHSFTLPLTYKGQELELEAKWVKMGYVSRFHVILENQELVFEQDDELQYRVLHPNGSDVSAIDKDMVEAVIEVLVKLTAYS